MIDIHCHILYGVDDGAEDFIDSCEMLRQAEESGITDIKIGRASCRERV